MKMLEFDIEVVAPNDMVPTPSHYDDNETHELLRYMQKVLFVMTGEWIWGDTETKGDFYYTMNGEKAGWHPRDGFNEEHKRSIVVDVKIKDEWQCGQYNLEANWRKVDEQCKNLKFKVELGASDNTIEYDVWQAGEDNDSMSKDIMVRFVRAMRRRIRSALIEQYFNDCENDEDLSSVVVNVYFPESYYHVLKDVPQWMNAQPRVAKARRKKH